ncbi:MAG: redoxin domain-containing protein [Proteobacteria bacterium]|nr:redoxin domain-containing protein [Pseudomonadota bacterium]
MPESSPHRGPNKVVILIGLLVVVPLLMVLLRAFSLSPPGYIESPLLEQAAPAFELPGLDDGALVTLDKYKGQPVVLNFWATWCASCPMEHPWLVRISDRFQGKAQFVGVAYNDKNEALKAWLAQHGGNAFPTLVDINGKVALAYGLYGVPETFVIDKDGVIRFKHVGPINPDLLVQQIESLL